jgi:hypothetical protein
MYGRVLFIQKGESSQQNVLWACLAVIAVVAASVAAAASPRNNYSSLYIHKTKSCSRCRCAAMPAEQAFIMAYGLFL